MERLILGGGSPLPVDRQMGQETVDLLLPHLPRMALPVEDDVTADPVDVRLLGSLGEVVEPHHFLTLIPKSELGVWSEPVETTSATPPGILPGLQLASVASRATPSQSGKTRETGCCTQPVGRSSSLLAMRLLRPENARTLP